MARKLISQRAAEYKIKKFLQGRVVRGKLTRRTGLFVYLVRIYGHPAGSWKKIKANTVLVDEDGEERRAEIHWYEADGGDKEEIKFKRWIK